MRLRYLECTPEHRILIYPKTHAHQASHAPGLCGRRVDARRSRAARRRTGHRTAATARPHTQVTVPFRRTAARLRLCVAAQESVQSQNAEGAAPPAPGRRAARAETRDGEGPGLRRRAERARQRMCDRGPHRAQMRACLSHIRRDHLSAGRRVQTHHSVRCEPERSRVPAARRAARPGAPP